MQAPIFGYQHTTVKSIAFMPLMVVGVNLFSRKPVNSFIGTRNFGGAIRRILGVAIVLKAGSRKGSISQKHRPENDGKQATNGEPMATRPKTVVHRPSSVF